MIYLVIWYLSDTLSPRNKPTQWKENYDHAIDWLRMAAAGDITPEMPVKQPPQGRRIRWGGQPKGINRY